ncbi:FeoA family protein [Vibrio sp. WJH972]
MNKAMTFPFPEKILSFLFGKQLSNEDVITVKNLSHAELNVEYEIKEVIQDNEEIVQFLFTLGCFKGESITLVSVLSDTYVISIKDARYSIDVDLARMVQLV